MVRIAIVGDPGSGGTTVLGLLYAAQVRWSSADGSAFRFHVAPSSMSRVGGIFEQLSAGEFPASSAAPSFGPVEFLFERPPSLATSLRERLTVGRTAPAPARRIEWTRGSLSDLRAHLATGGYPSEGARQLEGADVLGILVPATLLDHASARPDPDPDDTLLRALSAAGPRDQNAATASTGTAFIFTMLDRLGEAHRAQLGLPKALNDPVPSEHREEIGLRLLTEALPRTGAWLGSVLAAPSSGYVRPQFFYSWVETDPVGGGRLRLRSSPGGGWEPAYPFGEYVALIRACNTWVADRS